MTMENQIKKRECSTDNSQMTNLVEDDTYEDDLDYDDASFDGIEIEYTTQY